MAGRIDLEIGTRSRSAARRVQRDGPLRLLLIGDFSGIERTRSESLHSARIDVNNFDALFARTAPRVTIDTESLALSALEDCHPDVLYARLPALASWRDLRSRLLNPGTSKEAADELLRWAGQAGTEATPPAPSTSVRESDAGTLERLLGATPAGAPARRERSRVDGLIQQIVAPHIQAGADSRQASLLAVIDDAIGERVRAVLHAPAFQAMEARWRSVRALVTGLDDADETIELGLLDLSRRELDTDFEAEHNDALRTSLARLLDARAQAGAPWDVLVTDLSFSGAEPDLRALSSLGQVAAHAQAPLLAAAEPSLLGCESLLTASNPRDWPALDPETARRWQALRQAPFARWIGLAMPRLLCRLPYGQQGERIDAFRFEELPVREHGRLLWGNPAFGCAQLLAQAWLENGAEMEPGDVLTLEDLPAWSYAGDDGPVLQPVAEVLLGERAAEAILARGPMPFMSARDRAHARLLRFQSVADPPAPLAGRWA